MGKISIIVPFFNEEVILKKKANEIHAYFKKNFSNFEVIFVDDGSTDSSKSIVTSVIKEVNNLHIISYKQNKGRGFALTQGFKKASGDIIGYLDCDLEIKLKYIIPAVNQLNKYDIVIASKFLPKSKIETPFIRKISSIVYNQIVKVILNSRVSDHQAGFKFFNKQIIKSILPNIRERGWLWDVEVLYMAQKNNYTIYEIPISIRYGYRRIRSSFILDFLKLPIVFLKLRKRIDKRFIVHEQNA